MGDQDIESKNSVYNESVGTDVVAPYLQEAKSKTASEGARLGAGAYEGGFA